MRWWRSGIKEAKGAVPCSRIAGLASSIVGLDGRALERGGPEGEGKGGDGDTPPPLAPLRIDFFACTEWLSPVSVVPNDFELYMILQTCREANRKPSQCHLPLWSMGVMHIVNSCRQKQSSQHGTTRSEEEPIANMAQNLWIFVGHAQW